MVVKINGTTEYTVLGSALDGPADFMLPDANMRRRSTPGATTPPTRATTPSPSTCGLMSSWAARPTASATGATSRSSSAHPTNECTMLDAKCRIENASLGIAHDLSRFTPHVSRLMKTTHPHAHAALARPLRSSNCSLSSASSPFSPRSSCPPFAEARLSAQKTKAQLQVGQIANAINTYETDNSGKFPVSSVGANNAMGAASRCRRRPGPRTSLTAGRSKRLTALIRPFRRPVRLPTLPTTPRSWPCSWTWKAGRSRPARRPLNRATSRTRSGPITSTRPRSALTNQPGIGPDGRVPRSLGQPLRHYH